MPEARPHSELAEQTVTGPDQKGSTIRRYRPLDVHSYAEGARVISSVLLQLIFINVSDRDLRDLYYDQRVSGIADNYYHKHFINAAICCNTDPVIFKEPSQLRRQLFTAAGLDPDTGQYANCLKAGKVLVGSQAVAVSRPALLAVLQQGVAAPVAQLTIPTPLNFTQASMQVFVDQAIASWGNPEYVSPK
ncbi:hypothetical protein QJQ45_002998 [Haematococcus lacustris]|nr:hypothetical protein QJQ45_002998 [Haematococcus lacustris]